MKKYQCYQCHRWLIYTPDPRMPDDKPLICRECYARMTGDTVTVEDDEEDDLG